MQNMGDQGSGQLPPLKLEPTSSLQGRKPAIKLAMFARKLTALKADHGTDYETKKAVSRQDTFRGMKAVVDRLVCHVDKFSKLAEDQTESKKMRVLYELGRYSDESIAIHTWSWEAYNHYVWPCIFLLPSFLYLVVFTKTESATLFYTKRMRNTYFPYLCYLGLCLQVSLSFYFHAVLVDTIIMILIYVFTAHGYGCHYALLDTLLSIMDDLTVANLIKHAKASGIPPVEAAEKVQGLNLKDYSITVLSSGLLIECKKRQLAAIEKHRKNTNTNLEMSDMDENKEIMWAATKAFQDVLEPHMRDVKVDPDNTEENECLSEALVIGADVLTDELNSRVSGNRIVKIFHLRLCAVLAVLGVSTPLLTRIINVYGIEGCKSMVGCPGVSDDLAHTPPWFLVVCVVSFIIGTYNPIYMNLRFVLRIMARSTQKKHRVTLLREMLDSPMSANRKMLPFLDLQLPTNASAFVAMHGVLMNMEKHNHFNNAGLLSSLLVNLIAVSFFLLMISAVLALGFAKVERHTLLVLICYSFILVAASLFALQSEAEFTTAADNLIVTVRKTLSNMSLQISRIRLQLANSADSSAETGTGNKRSNQLMLGVQGTVAASIDLVQQFLDFLETGPETGTILGIKIDSALLGRIGALFSTAAVSVFIKLAGE